MKSILIHVEQNEYEQLLKIKKDKTWKQLLIDLIKKEEEE